MAASNSFVAWQPDQAFGRVWTPQQATSLRGPAVAPVLAPAASGTAAASTASGAGHWASSTVVAAAATALGLCGAARQRGSRLRPRPSRRGDAIPRAANPFEIAFGMRSPDGKKTAIITGASSGLGLATTLELARSGDWCVIMACRDYSKAAKAALDANLPEGSYIILHCDLAANNSVRDFVTLFRQLKRPLDALVCNAALYFPNAHKPGAFLPGLFPGGGPRFSADGYELSFAANYLGHFLLCNLLLDDLQKSSVKPARCIILGTVTASINDKEIGGMIPPMADIGRLQGLAQGMKGPDITMVDGGKFNGAKAYKDSKVCDVMMMRELHKRFHQSTGIVFSSLYPGCIAETGLFREHYPVFRTLFPVLQKEVTKAYVSEEEAGRRLAKVVGDPTYATSGSYYTWGGEGGTGGAGGTDAVENIDQSGDRLGQVGGFRTLSVDEIGGDPGDNERCRMLWELSEKLIAGQL
mmetsp:Transcript_35642/g.91903  ORF Transcript_35642/g.91903 Transcript_35642/m.91903 type:complete len:469 (-) Transcript_35642:128-1534(-)